jgi:hypothetical protein
MSVDIAAVLRDEAKAAQAIAERLSVPRTKGCCINWQRSSSK